MTEKTLKLSSKNVCDSHDENNFPHKLLLIHKFRGFVNFCKSVNIKLSKTRLHKIGELKGSFSRNLGLLLQSGLCLMSNKLKPLVKSVLIPLRLTAAASTKDAAIHKKQFLEYFSLFRKQCYNIILKCRKIQKVKIHKL